MWSYDVFDEQGTQTIALWVNGRPVSEASATLGGDWSGNNGASFGIGGTPIAGIGALSGSISGVDFTSGTINLAEGLQYYSTLPRLAAIEHPAPKLK